MTLELLTEFTHDNLRYKNGIKVISYKILNNWIDLKFDNSMDEVVSIDRFYNWVNKKREEKLFQLLD